jgi:SAM-dependent methyltransferase
MNQFSATDPKVVHEQYGTSANLDARIRLHAGFSTNRYGWLPWVFDQLLTLPATAVILEIGCGTGQLWAENADRIPAGWTITLSDQSVGMVAQAQAKLAPIIHPLTVEQIDAQQIPYAAGTFDAVIANHMLYHVPDLPQALAEFRRVLKPGGRLFAATNGKMHMVALGELAGRFDPRLNVKSFLAIDHFQLENGAAQIEPYFPQVECPIYADALLVTEAAALVDYILSMAPAELRQTISRQTLQAFIDAELAAHGGAITIAKSTGLFIAKKEQP